MPKGWFDLSNSSMNESNKSAASGMDGHGSMLALVSRSNQTGVMVSVKRETLRAAATTSET